MNAYANYLSDSGDRRINLDCNPIPPPKSGEIIDVKCPLYCCCKEDLPIKNYASLRFKSYEKGIAKFKCEWVLKHQETGIEYSGFSREVDTAPNKDQWYDFGYGNGKDLVVEFPKDAPLGKYDPTFRLYLTELGGKKISPILVDEWSCKTKPEKLPCGAIINTNCGAKSHTIFEDDFSSDKGWISSPPLDIVRDSKGNNVKWHADRSYDQRMYHSIDPITGDINLKVDAMISDATNNCDIKVGLIDDINNVLSSSGLLLQIGYYGGGTPYTHWYACVLGRYNDGTGFTSTTGEVVPSSDTWGGYVPISPSKWYSYELAKAGSHWSLMVHDANGRSVGSLSGELTGDFSPFRSVYIGNLDTYDWPSANGKIDNIKITSSDEVVCPQSNEYSAPETNYVTPSTIRSLQPSNPLPNYQLPEGYQNATTMTNQKPEHDPEGAFHPK